MYWEEKTATTVMRSVLDAKHQVRSAFTRLVTMTLDFYHGDQASWMEGLGNAQHVDDELGTFLGYFPKYFPEAWKAGSLFPLYQPFLQRVVNITAALFHRKPSLTLVDGNGNPLDSDDPQQAAFREIVQKGQLLPRLKYWHRITEAVKTAALFPSWVGGQMEFQVITPDQLYVAESDYVPWRLDLAKMVMHELPQPLSSSQAPGRRFVVWEPEYKETGTPASCRVTDLYGKSLSNPLFTDNINRYGKYPYVVARKGPPRFGIFADLDDCLINGQIGFNLAWTDAHLAMRTQWGGQAWFRTPEPNKLPDKMQWGRDVIQTLQGNAADGEVIGIENSNLDIGGFLKYIDSYMKTYAANYGLHPDIFSIDSGAASRAITAVAKAVDRIDLQETREDQEEYWRLKWAETWGLIKLVWNTANRSRAFDDDTGCTLEYAEPDKAQDPLHEAQAQQARINASLDSAVDIKARELDVSREEAKEIVLRNAKDNAEIGAAGLRQTPESNTEFQGGSENG